MEATVSTSRSLSTPADANKTRRRIGIALSALPTAFMLFDAAMKLSGSPFVAEATKRIGYPAESIAPIGLVLLACVVLYVIPRTSVLGATLLTGYLGGAVATNVRVGEPLFSHVLFPVYFAVLIWGGLYLRDARVRALAPWAAAPARMS
jgi:hypothetical protein